MIDIRSNSKEVAAAFKELARTFPGEMKNVLGGVGVWMKSKVVKTVQGKGPVPIAPLALTTLLIREAAGSMNKKIGTVNTTQGGRLKNVIRYKKGKESVRIGAIDSARDSFSLYQQKLNRDMSAETRRDFYLMLRKSGATRDQIDAVRVASRSDTWNKPARAIMEPLAKWPGLAFEMKKAAVKRMKSMAKKAKKRAQKSKAA